MAEVRGRSAGTRACRRITQGQAAEEREFDSKLHEAVNREYDREFNAALDRELNAVIEREMDAAIERADNETMAQFDALFDRAYDAVTGQATGVNQ
jgi:hypothetical protein